MNKIEVLLKLIHRPTLFSIDSIFTKTKHYLKSGYLFLTKISILQANIYLFKGNNRNTRKRYEICLQLTIKTPE